MASGPAGPDKSDAPQNCLSRDSTASLSCWDCGRLYDTQRGLSQRVRHVHPNTHIMIGMVPSAVKRLGGTMRKYW